MVGSQGTQPWGCCRVSGGRAATAAAAADTWKSKPSLPLAHIIFHHPQSTAVSLPAPPNPTPGAE